jgi:hypothetical protein
MEEAGDAAAQHENGLAWSETCISLASQDAGKRLHERGLVVRDPLGDREDAAIYIYGRDSDVFREPARFEPGTPQEGIADRVTAAEAVLACIAWDMMGRGYAVSRHESLHPLAGLEHLPGHFMAQHKRYLVPPVPLHHVTAAYAAGEYLEKQLSGADSRHRHLLDPHVNVAEIHQDSHTSNFRVAGKMGQIVTYSKNLRIAIFEGNALETRH